MTSFAEISVFGLSNRYCRSIACKVNQPIYFLKCKISLPKMCYCTFPHGSRKKGAHKLHNLVLKDFPKPKSSWSSSNFETWILHPTASSGVHGHFVSEETLHSILEYAHYELKYIGKSTSGSLDVYFAIYKTKPAHSIQNGLRRTLEGRKKKKKRTTVFKHDEATIRLRYVALGLGRMPRRESSRVRKKRV